MAIYNNSRLWKGYARIQRTRRLRIVAILGLLKNDTLQSHSCDTSLAQTKETEADLK